MNVVLDEQKYARQLIDKGFGKFMSSRDLTILAKYYYYEGYATAAVKKQVVDFCKKWNPEFNDVVFSARIAKIMRDAKKYPLRVTEKVFVSSGEISAIRTIDDYNAEKALFVMLVISKYLAQTMVLRNNTKLPDGYIFYSNFSFQEVARLANINIGRTQRYAMMKKLGDSKLISPTFTGAFKLNYAEGIFFDGDVVVTSLDDIASFYPYVCSSCGKETKKFPRHTMCEDCYADSRKEAIRKNVKKFREEKNKGEEKENVA